MVGAGSILDGQLGMEPRIDQKMTVTRFIVHILIGLFVCWVGSGGLLKFDPLLNLVGLAFILIGALGIIQTFVIAYKQSTGEWKSYDE